MYGYNGQLKTYKIRCDGSVNNTTESMFNMIQTCYSFKVFYYVLLLTEYDVIYDHEYQLNSYLLNTNQIFYHSSYAQRCDK